MVEQQTQTVGQWLEQLTDSNESSERDSIRMQNLLRRIGFSKAVCTCGIVYMEGYGYPVDIHSVARKIVEANKNAKSI